MSDFEWKPIERLSDADRNVTKGANESLYESWREAQSRQKHSRGAQLAEFNTRLIRRLSVETGILERLYDLDRGTTEALVANGFLEDLIEHGSTNIEPGRVIDMLRDHEAAVHLVIDCVTNRRSLTKSIMHELQSILTRHQECTTAIDGLGRRFEIPLLKGAFKVQANNPKRPDGSVHVYCPPIHVDAEVDNLLTWLREYSNEDPVLVAAWLHHRFTQIHPYQDGNGRVARALTTLVLLRADLIPLVVDRDLRTDYISALESADQSDLAPLVEMFSRLERNAILQALSVDYQARGRGLSAILDALNSKLETRDSAELAELRRVKLVAEQLRIRAQGFVTQLFEEIEPSLGQLGTPILKVEMDAVTPQAAELYKEEVRRSTNGAEKFANYSEAHYFLSGLIQVNAADMNFILSFHHIGRETTGIMEAAAFSHLPSGRFHPCSTEPFVFTHRSQLLDIEAPFVTWLREALEVAIDEFIDRL